MASEAFAGVGTKFQRWDGAAWQDIAEVNSIDGPGMTKDVLEVTSLDTDAGYNEFITGFAEGGTLTLDMNFTRETYELMKEDFESDEVRSYRIQLPDYDSEPSTFTIEGLVIELPITMTADDKVTADVVIQITGQVILDDGISWSSYWATRKPSDLIVTGMRDTEIDFSWTDNSAGDCSFAIYRSTDGVNYSSVGTTVAGDTTYTATGLTAGTLYYFYVVGVKSGNESDPTNIYDTRFKITVDTTKAGSAADTYILGVYKHVTQSYDFYVDWGDGGAEQHVSGTSVDPVSHTYAASGIYQVKVRGSNFKVLRLSASDAGKIIYLDNWGNHKLTGLNNAFRSCVNLQGRYTDAPNMIGVTNLEYMFYDCSVFNYEVNRFNTSNVTVFANMFRACTVFNQSVSNFNTSKGTDFKLMFYQCKAFNQSVANFNTANATNLSDMFNNCTVFNQSVANFDTAKATTLAGMFSGANEFQQDVSGFNLGLVTSLADFLLKTVVLGKRYNTSLYDAFLIAAAGQAVQSTVTLGVSATYTPGGAAEAARTYLTGTKGWTINDLGPSFSNGLLVINFDDGGASQYVAYEDLVSQGEKGTFYLISSQVGVGSNLTWAQVQTMLAGGMDIQCHTYDHPVLTTLNEVQVKAEYDDLDAQFVANSIPAAHHTSYPYGATSANVLTWTATKRLTGRMVTQGYVIPSSNKMSLNTFGMDAATNYDTLKAAMLVAQQNKWAMMVYGHGINGSQIPRDKFNEIIDYAQSIGMSIVTVSEMYAEMTP